MPYIIKDQSSGGYCNKNRLSLSPHLFRSLFNITFFFPFAQNSWLNGKVKQNIKTGLSSTIINNGITRKRTRSLSPLSPYSPFAFRRQISVSHILPDLLGEMRRCQYELRACRDVCVSSNSQQMRNIFFHSPLLLFNPLFRSFRRLTFWV